SSSILLPYWVSLFNRILQVGTLPLAWKQSYVKVLFKGKGDKLDPNSYRGLALNSAVFKLVLQRLIDFTRDYVPPEQYGFVSGRSTLQAVLKLLASVVEKVYNDRNKTFVYAAFIDYSKAFDSVSRQKLLAKLLGFGLKGQMFAVIKNILSENVFCVDDGIQISSDIFQNVGLLQGDSLSPYLFIPMTADLPIILRSECPEAQTIMYADDDAIWSTYLIHLQNAIDVLALWSRQNGLQINPTKTKIVNDFKHILCCAD